MRILEPREGRSHRHGTDTEKAAALAVMPRTGTQRAAVLVALLDAGDDGMTDFQLAERCGIRRPHTAGTRRGELQAAGFVESTGQHRLTDTNSPALVWKLTEDGKRAAALITKQAAA